MSVIELNNKDYILSPYHPTTITLNNISYPSLMHYIMSNLACNIQLRQEILNERDTNKLYTLGKEAHLQCLSVDTQDILVQGYYQRFKGDPKSLQNLRGNIVYENINDNFLGSTFSNHKIMGENVLGTVLEMTRDHFIEESITDIEEQLKNDTSEEFQDYLKKKFLKTYFCEEDILNKYPNYKDIPKQSFGNLLHRFVNQYLKKRWKPVTLKILLNNTTLLLKLQKSFPSFSIVQIHDYVEYVLLGEELAKKISRYYQEVCDQNKFCEYHPVAVGFLYTLYFIMMNDIYPLSEKNKIESEYKEGILKMTSEEQMKEQLYNECIEERSFEKIMDKSYTHHQLIKVIGEVLYNDYQERNNEPMSEDDKLKFAKEGFDAFINNKIQNSVLLLQINDAIERLKKDDPKIDDVIIERYRRYRSDPKVFIKHLIDTYITEVYAKDELVYENYKKDYDEGLDVYEEDYDANKLYKEWIKTVKPQQYNEMKHDALNAYKTQNVHHKMTDEMKAQINTYIWHLLSIPGLDHKDFIFDYTGVRVPREERQLDKLVSGGDKKVEYIVITANKDPDLMPDFKYEIIIDNLKFSSVMHYYLYKLYTKYIGNDAYGIISMKLKKEVPDEILEEIKKVYYKEKIMKSVKIGVDYLIKTNALFRESLIATKKTKLVFSIKDRVLGSEMYLKSEKWRQGEDFLSKYMMQVRDQIVLSPPPLPKEDVFKKPLPKKVLPKKIFITYKPTYPKNGPFRQWIDHHIQDICETALVLTQYYFKSNIGKDFVHPRWMDVWNMQKSESIPAIITSSFAYTLSVIYSPCYKLLYETQLIVELPNNVNEYTKQVKTVLIAAIQKLQLPYKAVITKKTVEAIAEDIWNNIHTLSFVLTEGVNDSTNIFTKNISDYKAYVQELRVEKKDYDELICLGVISVFIHCYKFIRVIGMTESLSKILIWMLMGINEGNECIVYYERTKYKQVVVMGEVCLKLLSQYLRVNDREIELFEGVFSMVKTFMVSLSDIREEVERVNRIYAKLLFFGGQLG